MLSEKLLLLLLDGSLLECLELGSFPSLLVFSLALLPVYLELLLPQLFDISLVLKLSHSSLLGIHLFQPFVFCELLSHLNLELFLHLAFLFQTYSLKLELIFFGSLQFFLHSLFTSSLFCFGSSKSLLHFFYLEIITKILNILLLFATLLLFQRKLIEYCLSLCLSLGLHGLQIISSLLLLRCILTHKLFFVFFELFLSLKKCLLFVDRKDHILLALFLFHLINSYHFVIFFNHLIDNGIDICSFLLIFQECILSKLFSMDHLILNVSLESI